MERGSVKVVFVSYVTLAAVASMSTLASRMTSTLVTLAVAASVRGEVLELEEACGVLLQERCPSLQQRVVSGIPSCAEKAPWNAILELRKRRKRRKREEGVLGEAMSEAWEEGGSSFRGKRATPKVGILCGGTLISSRHVVTAAHCLWANRGRARTCREPFLSMTPEQCRRSRCPEQCLRLGPDDINLYLGVTDRAAGPKPEPVEVAKIHIHPGWDRSDPLNNITAGHDIALIELKQPVNFSPTTWPICVPTFADRPLITEEMKVDAFGFGVREIRDTKRLYAEILNRAPLKVTNHKECKAAWKLEGEQVCAQGEVVETKSRVPDTCSGDSGGGLVARRGDDRFTLVGVVSFGESDCGARGGRPGVYTNVLSHASWIRNIIRGGKPQRRVCKTEDGRACVLPFSFRGTTFTSCTREHDPDDQAWCSTKVDKNGDHVENAGQWGHCSPECEERRSSPLQIEPAGEVEADGGSWSAWALWSPCSLTCGGGKKVRSRMCRGGSNCSGQTLQTKTCNSESCPVVRTWEEWGSWSSCSATCGKGTKQRVRDCPSTTGVVTIRGVPRRAGGGEGGCSGEGREEKNCRTRSCNGGGKRKKWSSWGAWSSCSSSCQGGVRQRKRGCVGDRGECFGTPTDTDICGNARCPMKKMAGDGSVSTLLVGGWHDDNWLSDVTVLHSDGKTCGAPSLPIWLADHVSVFDGSSVLTCGGRSSKETTLCWHLHLHNSSRSSWVRAPEMLEGRSYADAVESGGDVWVTGGWDGKVRHQSSEVLEKGGSWRNDGARLSGRRYQHCGVVLGDGSVVVTGGQDGETGRGNAIDSVERYGWNSGLIQELPNLNQARWTHACAVFQYQGREAIIVAGGRITSTPGDELTSVEVMVVGQPYWTFKAPLPQPRLAPAMVVLGGNPLLTGGSYERFSQTGGRREEFFPDDVLQYQAEEDVWRTVARMRGRSHHAMVAVPKTLLPSC